MPAMAVPDTEQEENFIIEHPEDQDVQSIQNTQNSSDDFDLSDLSVKPKEKTREDIIADAEAAAFAEAEG